MHDLRDSSSDEEGAESIPATVEKWLDKEPPVLTEGMVDILLKEEGALECLLSHVTLLDPKVRLPANHKGGELPYRARHCSLQKTKRSYNAMELLSSSSKACSRLLQNKFRPLVVQLFDIFEYNSNGNFHHFRKIFESMLRFKPIEFLDIILAPYEQSPPLALKMLDFLDESPVSASYGTILFFPLRMTMVEAERKRKLAFFLKTHQFIRKIVERMGSTDTNALAASDFLFRIIDECTRIESSDVILSCMEDPNDCLPDWIFAILFSVPKIPRNAQATSCFKVLLALLTKSSLQEFEVPVTTGGYQGNTTQKIPNGLADINEITKQKIIIQFPAICELLLKESNSPKTHPGVKFGTYEIKHGLPSMRVGALEVMFEAIKDLDDVSEALERLPGFFWKLITNWFFEFPQNSVYQAVFYKLIATALKSGHEPSLKNLITKAKFVSRMIQHYRSNPNSGCNGYILLVSNILRLILDSQRPTDYIPMVLSSHHEWNSFIKTVRDKTTEQVKQTCLGGDGEDFQRPLPHVGPLSLGGESEELMFLAPILKPDDIDLGSQFAYSLGFIGDHGDDDDSGDEAETKSTKKNRKNRKKRRNAKRTSSTDSAQKDE